jgi:hypothetical protein
MAATKISFGISSEKLAPLGKCDNSDSRKYVLKVIKSCQEL